MNFNDPNLRKSFMEVAGKDGLIDLTEWTNLIIKQYAGQGFSEDVLKEQAHSTFNLIDTNGSGKISFEEYVHAVGNMEK